MSLHMHVHVHEPRKSEVGSRSGLGSFVGKMIFFLAKVQGSHIPTVPYQIPPYFILLYFSSTEYK